MILEESYTLSNGVEIPKLGLGTWFISNKDAEQVVKEAVKIGYRHIDTAQAYRNESGVGDGVRNCGVKREELFVTTKLDAGKKSYQEAAVSIDNILENCSIKPMVNQILAHISNTPEELIQYTKEKDILVEAYSPIGHGELFKNEKIKEMAEKYNVSIPQLCIRYDLQLGLLPLPKSENPEHIKSNAEVDFTISKEDMEILKNMEAIEDYGAASIMPVYGGGFDLKSIISYIFQRIASIFR
ncbi:aldo/keto reductase [Halanaerobium sp. ST460_2HS_T2]|uniref:aldo/keto reductase n=1 Tax=Halanaerobium sp. ST460_2HS_T2 TaxID=2183914 RepID=UPI000DF29CCE|nr:aldo/keto reductase [Halanaerobium sp. ST460_2HS_T2]RCW62422.1 diketogulonate reductase-like aldo/keto reductase [Halanaerobium sp. ST460_2HS_T2]